MPIEFTCGEFTIKYPAERVYLYKSANGDCNIHCVGKLFPNNGMKAGTYLHIFYDTDVPNIIYFTPWIDGDPYRENTNQVPKGAKISKTNQPFRICFKNAGLFKALRIPCGESKQKGAAQSGFVVTPHEIEAVERRCVYIDLEEIPGWHDIYYNGSTESELKGE